MSEDKPYLSKKYWQSKERVVVFIDIANMIYSQRDFNLKKFKTYFERKTR